MYNNNKTAQDHRLDANNVQVEKFSNPRVSTSLFLYSENYRTIQNNNQNLRKTCHLPPLFWTATCLVRPPWESFKSFFRFVYFIRSGLHNRFYCNRPSSYLSDVDTSCFLALCMSVAEFSDGGDWVQSGILSQGKRNDLQRLGECTETILFHTYRQTKVVKIVFRP